VRSGVAHEAAAVIVRSGACPGGAQPSVDALVFASQELKPREFFFEREVVHYEAVELEAAGDWVSGLYTVSV